ncbi:hypothetical protein TEA_023957 [Camellia sinensis var. sinensis]|uniref:Uncharacterized protein n=1 Tax=Camellia sinensis var. sinensis TaxID=542762 RepID=A0A4S4CZM0_CAMSN|nr:hypothetical protein TEA_023957 [Camellia sinensis var. sinensis]
MELQFSSPSLLLAFLLFIFMVLKILINTTKPNRSTLKLPPGPWQLPLIGNMHQLISSSLTHQTLTNLAKKHGPLMHLRLGEVSTIVVSSPETAEQVMKTHDLIFAQRPYLLASRIISYNSTNICFAPYGDYWRQLRKICITEALSSKRVETFRGIREEEAMNFVRDISLNTGSAINLSKRIFSHTYGVTARAAFGKKSRDQEEFIEAMDEVLKLFGGFSVADMYPSVKLLQVMSGMRRKLEKLHNRVDQILENIVNEHRERKMERESGRGEAEDLVDVLLRVQKGGELEFPLTDDNIKAVILDIFSAGSETSSGVVEGNVRNAKKPRSNEKGTSRVIKETLRLHPSAPLLLPRQSNEQCTINGYEIPIKTKVIINAWAIGRDPRYWNEAEKFEPERFLNSPVDFKGTCFEYIPFGAGRRICPGIAFAIPNIELPLAQLLYHFDWKLPGGMKREELDMTEVFALTALVPIVWKLKKSSDSLPVIPPCNPPCNG